MKTGTNEKIKEFHKKWESGKKADFVNNVNTHSVREIESQFDSTDVHIENLVTHIKSLFLVIAKKYL